MTNIVFAAGGHSGNGSGLSEMNMVSVYESLNNYLQKIIDSKLYTETEEKYVATLLSNQDHEPKNLLFTNPRKNPEIFSNESIQFYTGKNIGDPIYLNQDALFKIEQGERVSLNMIDALNLTLTILNTRYSSNIYPLLEKNKSLFGPLSVKVSLKSYKRPDIGIELLSVEKTKIYLTSEENKLEITKLIEASVECSPGHTLSDVAISNVFFDDIGVLQEDKVELYFLADLGFKCGRDAYSGKIEITSKLKLQGENLSENWQYDSKIVSEVIGADVSIFNIVTSW